MSKARAKLLAASSGDFVDQTCSGRFLVATPGMLDERFERSVIYMCAHSDEGAMGIIINHPASHLAFPAILEQLDRLDIEAPAPLQKKLDAVPVFRGGPVEPGRGFVLHSGDIVLDENSLKVGDELYLTTTLEMLSLISKGQGPQEALFALGYAGWSPGQLEQELQGDGWLTCDMDRGLLFDKHHDTKYQRALGQIGIDLAQFSTVSGRA